MPSLTTHFIPAWTRPFHGEDGPVDPLDDPLAYQQMVEGMSQLNQALVARDLAQIDNALMTLAIGDQAHKEINAKLDQWLDNPELREVVAHLVAHPVATIRLDEVVTSWRVLGKWGALEGLLNVALTADPDKAQAWLDQCGPDRFPRVTGALLAQSRATHGPLVTTPSRRRFRS